MCRAIPSYNGSREPKVVLCPGRRFGSPVALPRWATQPSSSPLGERGMVYLLSVNVGLPRDIEWQGRVVNTAIWKMPVEGLRMVRRLNIDGDGQADRAGHGGETRAVYVYQMDSYRYWEEHLNRSDFVSGQFGENFTVEGL